MFRTAITFVIAIALALTGVFAQPIEQAHAASLGAAKIASASSMTAGKITVKAKKVGGAAKYQFQVSQQKSFPSVATKAKKAKSPSATFAKLDQSKRYYVRARAWSKTAGWGKWSAVKSVKVKAAKAPAPDPAFVYVDAGRRSAKTTEWSEATQSYVGIKVYELYITSGKKAPAKGAAYGGGRVAAVLGAADGKAYPTGSVTLRTSAPLKTALVEFSECTAIDVSRADISATTNLDYAFLGAYTVETLDVSNWDMSNVKSDIGLLAGFSALRDLRANGLKLGRPGLSLAGRTSLERITGVEGWDTVRAERMDAMFYRCLKLKSLDLSAWNVSNVVDMSSMFSGCEALEDLDLSGWDTARATDMGEMLLGCTALKTLKTGEGWRYNAGLTAMPYFPVAMTDENGDEHAARSPIPEGAHTYAAA